MNRVILPSSMARFCGYIPEILDALCLGCSVVLYLLPSPWRMMHTCSLTTVKIVFNKTQIIYAKR